MPFRCKPDTGTKSYMLYIRGANICGNIIKHNDEHQWTNFFLILAGLLNRGSLRAQALCPKLVLTPLASYLQMELQLKLTKTVYSTWLYFCLMGRIKKKSIIYITNFDDPLNLGKQSQNLQAKHFFVKSTEAFDSIQILQANGLPKTPSQP